MQLKDRVDSVLKKRREANEEVRALIAEIKRDANIPRNSKKYHLKKLFDALSGKDITQALVPDVLRFDVGTSLRSSVSNLRRTKMRMRPLGVNIFPGHNPKLQDRAFGKELGIPVPTTYAQEMTFGEIELKANAVLKPHSGASSFGVFI